MSEWGSTMEDMQLVSNQGIEEVELVDSKSQTKYEQFIARTAEKKLQDGKNPTVRSSSWADPDPLAISQVAASKHPLTALINRRKGNAVTVHQRRIEIRGVCARLQGVETTSLTWEDAMRYPWHLVDADMAASYYQFIFSIYSHKPSAYPRISLLRAIIDTCFRAKLISVARRDEVLDELLTKSDLSTKGVKVRLTDSQLESLMKACSTGNEKEAALISSIVALFSTTGLRGCELVALDLADWDRGNKTMCLRITKNGRPHTIPVVDGVTEYLEHWLEFRGNEEGALFTQNKFPSPRRLSTACVRNRLDNRAREAGIARLKPHDFRRTVASQLLRKVDIALVSRLLNHTSTASTLIYDMVTEDEQRAAVTGLHLPSFAPKKEGE